MLVVLFMALWLVFLPLGYPMPYGFLIVMCAELAMLLTCLRLVPAMQTSAGLDRLHGVLLVLELACHTTIFYFLGGISWLGSIAFLYATMYAGVFLTWRQAVAFAALVCTAFVGVVVLDGTGTLPHQWYLPQDADRYRDAGFLVPTTVSFVVVIATVALWMVFVGSELRRERDTAISAYGQLASAQEELRQLNEELEVKVAERTRVLSFRAEHDTLTGLLNRGTISRRCSETLALARRTGQQVAVIVADADGFKTCNDTGGHVYGDDVLRTVADTLREASRESDVVGRFGGDEFLIVLPDTSIEGASQYCRRVIETLADRRLGRRHEVLPFPDLSMGIAVFPQHGGETDELIRVADRAMYAAKNDGGGHWRVGRGEERSDEALPAAG